MQILFLATWFPYPLDNGSRIRVHHLLKALSERHSVTFLGFAFGTACPAEAAELEQKCHDVQVVWEDIRIGAMGLPSRCVFYV